jgi:membrane-associated phospholipid phosphatase
LGVALWPARELGPYIPDYTVTAALGGLALALYVFPLPVNNRPPVGPAYDPARRDTSHVYQARWDRVVGHPHRPDSVPWWAPTVVGSTAILGLAGLRFAQDPGWRKVHATVLGAVQTQLATYVLTEVGKSAVGRLRPDYRDRMDRHYCGLDRGAVPEGVNCAHVRAEARALRAAGRDPADAYLDHGDFEDGRRSFPSGHTSAAFATATYFALVAGGELVWGDDATGATRAAGVALQAAALGMAAMVGASRLLDHRHHPEDVVAGAALGATNAVAAYVIHFDVDGIPRRRSLRFNPLAGRDGGGLLVSVALP